MAGSNNKKKKKVPTNPARGFATTSIQSIKSKVDDSYDTTSTEVSGAATPDTVPASTGSETSKAGAEVSQKQRELHELTPEELEAQLEASELQQLVEHNAPKVRKESLRQASRLQTDKRVLRVQADSLSVKDWLPDELMRQVLDLLNAENSVDPATSRTQIAPSREDLLPKVWALRLCLLDLEFPAVRTTEALIKILSSPPPLQDNSGLLWGLSDALEWLALNCEAGELSEYDYQRQRAVIGENDDFSETQVEDTNKNDNLSYAEKKTLRLPVEQSSASVKEANEINVSDIDDDLEPDEKLSIYLRTKARLFEINPAVERQLQKKGAQISKTATHSLTPESNGERKLQQKLKKIESDVLFDQREADLQWASRKIDLAREAAERRKLYLAQNEHTRGERVNRHASQTDTVSKNSVTDEAERLGQELLKESEDVDDADLLGGMFNTLDGLEEPALTGQSSLSAPTTNIIIRDFGRLTGMNPKRILEETCKSRDAHVKIAYKLISPTTYASRHSVTINWTKDQETEDASFLKAVIVKSKPRSVFVTVTGIATPDIGQSEACVATIALFLVFSGSPKEEKAHMKLPPAFRDLWDELTSLKQQHIDSSDREIVNELRELIKQHVQLYEENEPDEVVFNAASRRSIVGFSGASTPNSQRETEKVYQSKTSEQLAAMWAQKASTPSYQRMLDSRKNLPMFQFRTVALETIERHQITILCGETGCGKSTQLPAFILEGELSQGRHCKVYCTEPRRISAISLARRVSEEMGEHRGDVGTARSLVGYSIRLESHTTANTRLVYATVGIVLRMLENADGISDVTHLVIDEVHERSIDTDFLLIVLRSLLLRRPDLKVVLMSATVDAEKFSRYLDDAPIINVPGRTFPVQAKFLEDAIELTGHTNEDASTTMVEEEDGFAEGDPANKAGDSNDLAKYSKLTRSTLAKYDEYRIDYTLIMKLLQKVASEPTLEKFSNAILVFLPGISEIRQLNEMLTSGSIFNRGWKVYPLHSSFSSEDQQAAFDIPQKGVRKIVLATNIAETGITIPDVTCVIDTGKHKEMRFDERRQLSKLILSFIARANAKQRRGRAGRVQEGICFHLFTKHRHDMLMAEQQTPEMLRLSLQDLVMRVKICKLGDIEHALSQALDPPSNKNIRRAIDALIEVDALTASEELTPLGSQLAKLPLDAQLGKLVLLGSIFGCLDFALTAAATLTSKSPFLSPMHAKKQAETVRMGYKRGDSDLLTLYNAYCAWRKVCTTPGMSEFQFCNKNFLSSQNLVNIEDLKGQLLTSLVEAEFVQLGPAERSALAKVRPGSRHRNFLQLPPRYTTESEDDTMATCVLAWSFYPKIIIRDGKGWRNIANNQSLGLHPTSVNKHNLSSDIQMLSFYSIMQSSSRFTNAQETTPAPDLALVLLAGEAVFHLYAGVVVIDGNRLRYKVRDWKTMIVLKTLRRKAREILSRLFRHPGRELAGRQKMWMEIIERIFERQHLQLQQKRKP